MPEALNWEIDLFTVQECIPIIQKHLNAKRIQERDYALAEKALIQESRPAVNNSLNPDASTLLSKYTHKRMERIKREMQKYSPRGSKAD